MKHTKEEILNALQIIKDECIGSRCEQCSFGASDALYGTFCKLKWSNPEYWIIKGEEETVWRALENEE